MARREPPIGSPGASPGCPLLRVDVLCGHVVDRSVSTSVVNEVFLLLLTKSEVK